MDTSQVRQRDCWQFDVLDQPSGLMELYETPAGFTWFWRNKPAHLVAINGVPDDSAPAAETKVTPYRFPELEDAIHHLLFCSGVAFYGRCGLTAVH